MKIGIVGHFAKNKNLNDGQTVKTRNLYDQLVDIYGQNEVKVIDTYQYKKHMLSLLINCMNGIKNAENIIMLPARNGVKIFVPLFLCFNKIFHKKLFYVVVGGWLPEFLLDKPRLQKHLQKLDYILVETENMKNKLNKLGINNVDILVNFKKIAILKDKKRNWKTTIPLKVCTFSRVIKEKGIENAIRAVSEVNKKEKNKIYHLDIYGPISENYKEEFDTLLKKYQNDVSYKGVIEANNSVNTLKQYHLLLFPTYYEGEGLAGTIIDAFSSGVPVVASDWRYNTEVVKDGYNGFIFQTKNDKELIEILYNVYKGKYPMEKIKENCLKSATAYIPENAIKGLTKYIN